MAAASRSPSLYMPLSPSMHTSSSAFLGTSFSMTVDVVIVCAAVIVLVFVLCACYCLCCSSKRKRRGPPRSSSNRPPPADIVTYQQQPQYELTPYQPQPIQAPVPPPRPYQAPPPPQPISFARPPPQPQSQFTAIHPDAPAITPIPSSGVVTPPIATKPAVSAALRAQPYTGVPHAHAKRGFAYDSNVRDENEEEDEVGSVPLSDFGVPLAMHERRDQHGEEQRRTLANWTRDSN